jgi:hypothetical protein
MTAAGAALFARYAYPPNELGYCGPPGAGPDEVGRRAPEFEGAWPYLSYLAAATGIGDPLDERVVTAYWIGSPLLDRVDGTALVDFLRPFFAGQTGGTWARAGRRAVAHHSFHVFEVYPWLSLLRRTGSPAAVNVLNRCRIRRGTVESASGGHAVVVSSPLVWRDHGLTDGEPRLEQVRTLVPGLRPGDRVALHWDWICDTLTGEDEERLRAYEARSAAADQFADLGTRPDAQFPQDVRHVHGGGLR